MVNWFEKRCLLAPDHIAIIDGDTGERWSYREAEIRACRVAGYLQSHGVAKGDRVALLSRNDVCYFDLLFACGKLGAIFVPLNWRLSANELRYILDDCTPKAVVIHDDMQTLWDGEASPYKVISISDAEYEAALQSDISPAVTEQVHSSDPFAIIYTGGTTGKPKGVVLSHASIFWNSVNTVLSWNLTSNDITPTYMPMFHTGGLNALSLPVLQIGGTVIVSKAFDADKTIELINREHCTIILLVPTMYHMLIKSPLFAATDFPAMHTFLSGGAPCPHTVYQAFVAKGLNFKEGYGLTEAGPNNFYIHPEMAAIKIGSVGKPMILNDIKITDSEGEETKPGEVGEIMLRGGHLFESYWRLPEATAQAFTDGWLHTGDLGRKDEDGYFYIMGRKKDMIITGGENVYPLEVEHLIRQHPSVKEAVVVGLPDDKWGEVVAAVVVTLEGSELDEEQLREYCACSIGKYKVPKKFFYVDELPKTPVGKIDINRIVQSYS
ncbi:long-chain fatty acid--CoA ligase [Cohnella kolymensis]|uniref:Long-chain fatty acid--CoA ligase n=2 Tax=Cohnella kolymensis TaxID=1590652 RepID=A0ABR5A244_9BACL|nr:long-chain fatty acid--CoA ligase [Cohnella kolymensis]